jgi:hypothetical protein
LSNPFDNGGLPPDGKFSSFFYPDSTLSVGDYSISASVPLKATIATRSRFWYASNKRKSMDPDESTTKTMVLPVFSF